MIRTLEAIHGASSCPAVLYAVFALIVGFVLGMLWTDIVDARLIRKGGK